MAISKIVRERVGKLHALIEYHRKRYHEEDTPEISDEAYYSLVSELQTLEQQYPELQRADSPTVRIGGTPLSQFEKVAHQVPQWSFDNVFDEEELADW